MKSNTLHPVLAEIAQQSGYKPDALQSRPGAREKRLIQALAIQHVNAVVGGKRIPIAELLRSAQGNGLPPHALSSLLLGTSKEYEDAGLSHFSDQLSHVSGYVTPNPDAFYHDPHRTYAAVEHPNASAEANAIDFSEAIGRGYHLVEGAPGSGKDIRHHIGTGSAASAHGVDQSRLIVNQANDASKRHGFNGQIRFDRGDYWQFLRSKSWQTPHVDGKRVATSHNSWLHFLTQRNRREILLAEAGFADVVSYTHKSVNDPWLQQRCLLLASGDGQETVVSERDFVVRTFFTRDAFHEDVANIFRSDFQVKSEEFRAPYDVPGQDNEFVRVIACRNDSRRTVFGGFNASPQLFS